MKTYKFKTNINCGNCLGKVKPFLDQVSEVTSWEVDLNNPDKILTVQAEQNPEVPVVNAVKSVGFKADLIND
ncbi:MAG: heavy-metal-associated domain-containing protein [Bacteroidia bacterium]